MDPPTSSSVNRHAWAKTLSFRQRASARCSGICPTRSALDTGLRLPATSSRAWISPRGACCKSIAKEPTRVTCHDGRPPRNCRGSPRFLKAFGRRRIVDRPWRGGPTCRRDDRGPQNPTTLLPGPFPWRKRRVGEPHSPNFAAELGAPSRQEARPQRSRKAIHPPAFDEGISASPRFASIDLPFLRHLTRVFAGSNECRRWWWEEWW